MEIALSRPPLSSRDLSRASIQRPAAVTLEAVVVRAVVEVVAEVAAVIGVAEAVAVAVAEVGVHRLAQSLFGPISSG